MANGPIIAGFPWTLEIPLEPPGPYFPTGCSLKAQFRTAVGGTLLAECTTENGRIERVNDSRIRISVPFDVSAAWAPTVLQAVFDVVRTDVTPDTHYGFRGTVPVLRSVTT